jgi:hypothetical protein
MVLNIADEGVNMSTLEKLETSDNDPVTLDRTTLLSVVVVDIADDGWRPLDIEKESMADDPSADVIGTVNKDPLVIKRLDDATVIDTVDKDPVVSKRLSDGVALKSAVFSLLSAED